MTTKTNSPIITIIPKNTTGTESSLLPAASMKHPVESTSVLLSISEGDGLFDEGHSSIPSYTPSESESIGHPLKSAVAPAVVLAHSSRLS